jgi:hypothetical protein
MMSLLGKFYKGSGALLSQDGIWIDVFTQLMFWTIV